MTKVAIYARYSSDLQSTASIADQVRLCRELADREGQTVVEVYTDKAIGASSLRNRPGMLALMEAARAGSFDMVIAEALDRISRDQEDVAAIFKRLVHADVQLVTFAEGRVNELHVGLKGTMNALFLKDLAEKTRRGQRGRVEAGRSPGGRSYGYHVFRRIGEDGALVRGERGIDPDEAAVIRRIFEAYAAGRAPRAIAADLTRAGIPAPRNGKCPGTWSFSTISGNWRRGTGILNNELYIGRLVWNRQRFVKDPVTGRRQARPNPREAWVVEEVPELHIVEDRLWAAVKRRQGLLRTAVEAASEVRRNGFGVARRPRYLFSGLLKCGRCGAGYTLVNGTKYGCSASRNRGTCANRALMGRADLEIRVLEGLRDRLMHPDLVAEFLAEYQREWNRLRADETAARTSAERELAQVVGRIAQLLDAIERGMFHPSMQARMTGLEARKAELDARLATLGPPEPPVLLHPGLTEVYRRKVADLATALNAEGTRAKAAEILRGLVEEIRLHPEEEGHAIEIVGDLAGILAVCGEGKQTPRALLPGASDSVVAGVGFEPTTFRL